ncbi:SIR2 family protein [Paenibacillus sp. LjRoot153]|uniref:SIR2 family protein n=1 Tax=Paenibacillus sp. LjRoot153 TaxID=3342270 RepID=UPI003ED06DE9
MNPPWPQHLIAELAARRCVIFLGSGVSAQAVNAEGRRPSTWGQFLTGATNLVQDQNERQYIQQLIGQGKYLLALQCIFDHSDRGDYNRFLRGEYLEPRYEPTQIHEDIVMIDPKITITTNFDIIYDKACRDEGHTVIKYYDSNIIEHLRSDQRLIIKAHGTIESTQEMIFTKSKYFETKKKYAEFYNILQAIFITNTILFIGCGMEDPDINLLLETVYLTTGESLEHYVVTREGVNHNQVKDWKNSYNIKTLTYGPTHDDLVTEIRNLRTAVEAYRTSNNLF